MLVATSAYIAMIMCSFSGEYMHHHSAYINDGRKYWDQGLVLFDNLDRKCL